MSVNGDVTTEITTLVMTQTYPTFFNVLFILINFEVYNYYVILATLTAGLKPFIVTYVKNCMIDVSLPV